MQCLKKFACCAQVPRLSKVKVSSGKKFSASLFGLIMCKASQHTLQDASEQIYCLVLSFNYKLTFVNE